VVGVDGAVAGGGGVVTASAFTGCAAVDGVGVADDGVVTGPFAAVGAVAVVAAAGAVVAVLAAGVAGFAGWQGGSGGFFLAATLAAMSAPLIRIPVFSSRIIVWRRRAFSRAGGTCHLIPDGREGGLGGVQGAG